MSIINFEINKEQCVKCGLCAADCPAGIITFGSEGFPGISPDQEASCYKCQHCLAICPSAAVSILGRKPEDSRLLAGNYPTPNQLETLIKGRRSVRKYKNENLNPALIRRLLDVTGHAPSGVNTRQVLFTVIDDREKMDVFRREIMDGLCQLTRRNALPESLAFFAHFVRMWEENGTDVIFRGAPHLLITSVPPNVPSPMPDCLIAMSYFELFAQSLGVGTVWCGLAKWAFDDLLPESRIRLGIPPEHVIGYSMLFGKPAVHYTRTVQYPPITVNQFKG